MTQENLENVVTNYLKGNRSEKDEMDKFVDDYTEEREKQCEQELKDFELRCQQEKKPTKDGMFFNPCGCLFRLKEDKEPLYLCDIHKLQIWKKEHNPSPSKFIIKAMEEIDFIQYRLNSCEMAGNKELELQLCKRLLALWTHVSITTMVIVGKLQNRCGEDVPNY